MKALIIDSWFDNYHGTVSLVRVVDGKITKRGKVKMSSTGREHQVEEVGVFTPKKRAVEELAAGDVGYIIAGIKDIKAAKVGDTIIDAKSVGTIALPGFKEEKPTVFASRIF